MQISDPQALAGVAARHPELVCCPDPYEALEGAQLVLLLTEWSDFLQLDPLRAASCVAQAQIIDGRNALDPAAWEAAGWSYAGLGR